MENLLYLVAALVVSVVISLVIVVRNRKPTSIEAGIEASLPKDRAVRTASVTQVKEPISTSRIGQSAAFERHLKPFRDRYYS